MHTRDISFDDMSERKAIPNLTVKGLIPLSPDFITLLILHTRDISFDDMSEWIFYFPIGGQRSYPSFFFKRM